MYSALSYLCHNPPVAYGIITTVVLGILVLIVKEGRKDSIY